MEGNPRSRILSYLKYFENHKSVAFGIRVSPEVLPAYFAIPLRKNQVLWNIEQ
jgi:hypothetical protein